MTAMTTPPEKASSFVHVPETVSEQAQEFLRTIKDPRLIPRFPDPEDLSGWKKLQAWAEVDGTAKSKPLLERYKHTVKELSLGGVPVLDVRPQDWQDNGTVRRRITDWQSASERHSVGQTMRLPSRASRHIRLARARFRETPRNAGIVIMGAKWPRAVWRL